MKKIIIVFILFFNIVPNITNNKITIEFGSKIYAQQYGCNYGSSSSSVWWSNFTNWVNDQSDNFITWIGQLFSGNGSPYNPNNYDPIYVYGNQPGDYDPYSNPNGSGGGSNSYYDPNTGLTTYTSTLITGLSWNCTGSYINGVYTLQNCQFNFGLNDCAGVPLGGAYVGSCGFCVGGSTGINACYVDTPRVDTVKPTKIPCLPAANARGVKLTNIRDSINNLPDVIRLKDSSLISLKESGVSITKNAGAYGTFNFQTGAANNVGLLTSSPGQNIKVGIHTHNKGTNDSSGAANSPSPLDLYHLINGQASNPNYIADYVFAHDSTEWAIMIDDTTKATALTITIPMDSAAEAPPLKNNWSNTFKLSNGISLYKTWKDWVLHFYNTKHYPKEDIEAFANVLFAGANLDAGVKYYKKVNGEFKELSYQIINDASGNPIDIIITICQ
jgi:hypothetical protein